MHGARFFNKSKTPLAWSNICDDVTEMDDAIEDAMTAKELMENVNMVSKFEKFTIDRETKEYVRLIAHDCFGNTRYIKAWF